MKQPPAGMALAPPGVPRKAPPGEGAMTTPQGIAGNIAVKAPALQPPPPGGQPLGGLPPGAAPSMKAAPPSLPLVDMLPVDNAYAGLT